MAVAKLSQALGAALNTDVSVCAFNAMGFEPGDGAPGQMGRQIARAMDLFTAIIRERNLKFDI